MQTLGDSGLAELTMRGVLHVSDVLGVDGTLHEPLWALESQILEVEGVGSDSDTLRRLLTVPMMLGHSERVTANSRGQVRYEKTASSGK